MLKYFFDRLLGRNRCANCAHWLSADRERGECQLWKSIALPAPAAIRLPLAGRRALAPGTKVAADESCSGFALPDVAIGRAYPAAQPEQSDAA